MKKANLCKNPRKIGEISRHQWGVVVDRGGELQHSNIFTVEVSGVNGKAMAKKIICLGNYYGQKQGCTGSVYCSGGGLSDSMQY